MSDSGSLGMVEIESLEGVVIGMNLEGQNIM